MEAPGEEEAEAALTATREPILRAPATERCDLLATQLATCSPSGGGAADRGDARDESADRDADLERLVAAWASLSPTLRRSLADLAEGSARLPQG